MGLCALRKLPESRLAMFFALSGPICFDAHLRRHGSCLDSDYLADMEKRKIVEGNKWYRRGSKQTIPGKDSIAANPPAGCDGVSFVFGCASLLS